MADHPVGPWKDLGSEAASKFTPEPFFDIESDSITYYFAEDESYHDRIDPLLTVYRSHKTNDIVGFAVTGVTQILNTFHSLHICASPDECIVGALLMGVFVTFTEARRDMTVMQAAEMFKQIPEAAKQATFKLAA